MSNLYSQHRDERYLTTHKSDFSFCSPLHEDQPTTAPKNTALRESRTIDYMRNRAELFAEDRKENENMLSMINKTYSHQFIQELRNQHRIQVEKLLLEISRLHDHIDSQERSYKNYILKIKEDSEQNALLRISNLRQSQVSQLQIVDAQLRKTREALEEKNAQMQELQRQSTRKIENLMNENQSLKNDLRKAIQDKNEELYNLKGTFDKQSENIFKKKEEQLAQMRDLSEKQFKKIEKRLLQKEQFLEDLKRDYEDIQDKKSNLELKIQQQRIKMEDRLTKVIESQRDKQLQLVANLKQFYHAENQNIQEEIKMQKEMSMHEIDNLVKIIKLKDSEAQRNMMFRETQRVQFKLLSESLQNENAELKKKIHRLKQKQLEELELLKVKMAVLHQNDIQQLVKIYEAKIENLTRQLKTLGQQYEKMENEFIDEKSRHYKTKKKYDYSVSRLNEEVLILKTGMVEMEKDYKQKLEGEKSMMMLTSRSLIKQAELKNTNVKFYEEQLRKLRQLLEIQAQQVEDSERNVEQKIRMAEDELTRLSNKILQIKGESEQAEKRFKQIIEEKDQEINRLNKQLNAPTQIKNQIDENQEIKKLQELIGEKEDQIRTFKVRCEDLESDVRQYRADIERLNMQSQINTEEARKHYKAISDKNLLQMKSFYERRLRELENDKSQLGRINSNQTEQITELIKKYKQAEEGMKQLLKQSKKRGQLQNRIINLGMDNNLVKNMAELFHK